MPRHTASWLVLPLGYLLISGLFARAQGEPPSPPPPVAQAMPRALSPDLRAAQAPQRVYGPSADTLVARQTADGILEGFRKTYHQDGAPRIVIYVNRALVDVSFDRAQAVAPPPTEKPGAPAKAADTGFTKPPPAAGLTLADQQTVREIERLFGRAFRHAGAQLADQTVAAAMLPAQPGTPLAGEQAARDRQALANVADLAIEVLISSRNLAVPEVSGDATYSVPDIQATAIRLKDAAIVGQAAASDIIGRGTQAGRVARQFTAQEITEATALALMEDMLTGKR
jgi:hypothetical protein